MEDEKQKKGNISYQHWKLLYLEDNRKFKTAPVQVLDQFFVFSAIDINISGRLFCVIEEPDKSSEVRATERIRYNAWDQFEGATATQPTWE